MAMHGVRNHGGCSVNALTKANTPQKNVSTQAETAIFSAATKPTIFASPSSVTSNKMLFHCLAIDSPGAFPFSINCASQALYTWLARSPASMCWCQKHGISNVALTARTSHHQRRKKARVAFPSYKKCAHVSKMSCSGPISLLGSGYEASLFRGGVSA